MALTPCFLKHTWPPRAQLPTRSSKTIPHSCPGTEQQRQPAHHANQECSAR